VSEPWPHSGEPWIDIGDVVKNFQNSAKSFRNILAMMTDFRERALSLTSLTRRLFSEFAA